MRNRKRLPIIATLLIALIGICTMGSTYAFLIDQDEVVNKLSMGKVQVEVKEEFVEPESWNGDAYPKEVQVMNWSEGPVLIRVSIIPRWIDENDSTWVGDTSIINPTYCNVIGISDWNKSSTEKWVYGDDGYYYYTSKMIEQKPTSVLLQKVDLKDGLPSEILDEYKGKTLIIDVNAEAVQATWEAVQDTWPTVSDDISAKLKMLCE